MSDVGTALILGWGPGLGGDGLLLEDDMRNPIQGEHGLSVNGVLLPADDHLAFGGLLGNLLFRVGLSSFFSGLVVATGSSPFYMAKTLVTFFLGS